MRRLLAAALVAATAFGFTLAPSAAVSATDPTGDAVRPQGDIGRYVVRLDSASDRYVVKVAVARGVDPVTTKSWRGTNTAIRIYWDTSPLPGEEFLTTLHTVGSPAVFTGETTANLPIDLLNDQGIAIPSGLDCTATAPTGTGGTIQYLAPNTYKVRVPVSCLPGAASVSARIEMTFDPRPAGGTDTDNAPNNGYVDLPAA